MAHKFIEGRITGRTDYTDVLFSLRFEAAMEPFVAGQFCRVGLWPPATEAAVMRPYSMVNAPDERPFEIVLIKVLPEAGGILSPALHGLGVGDQLCVSPKANGFFTLAEVPAAPVLWALATGTAIGPFLSMMKTAALWQKFGQVVLVHAVRTEAELTYRGQIEALAAAHPAQFHYVPFVSRQNHPSAMRGRIPEAIANGSLEARVGRVLSAETAHCMLCGNPDMVRDTMAALALRGLKKHRPKHPGQVTVEAYW
jgi:ferredoxin/flavodoxin---NADP+ reductase